MACAGYLDLAKDPAISAEPLTDGTIYNGSWLDLLAESVYDVTRKQATYATGTIKLNGNYSGTQTYSFLPGTCHISYLSNTYSNVSTLTIGPSSTVISDFISDKISCILLLDLLE